MSEQADSQGEPMSGFSFMTSDSTGSSGFGFISSSSAERGEEVVEEASSTGFTFLSSSSNQESVASSGFSFLNAATSEVPAPAPLVSSTAFSFLSDSSNSVQPTVSHDDMLGPVVSAPAQDIRLAKTAQTKAVKKKKKVSRVGFARDDEEGDDVAVETSPLPKPIVNPAAADSASTLPAYQQSQHNTHVVPEQQQHQQQQPSPRPSNNQDPRPHEPSRTRTKSEEWHDEQQYLAHVRKQEELEKAQNSPQVMPSTASSTSSATIATPSPQPKRGSFLSWFRGKGDGHNNAGIEAPSEAAPENATTIPTPKASIEAPVPWKKDSNMTEPAKPPGAVASEQPHDSSRRPSLPQPTYAPEPPPSPPQVAMQSSSSSSSPSNNKGATVVAELPPMAVPPPPSVPPPVTVPDTPKTAPPRAPAPKPPLSTSPSSEPVPKPIPQRQQSQAERFKAEIERIYLEFHEATSQLVKQHLVNKDGIRSCTLQTEMAGKEIRKCRKLLLELEAEQQLLAESEEFEKAAALSDRIEAVREDLRRYQQNISKLETTMKTLMSQEEKHYKEQANALEEVQQTLEQLKCKQLAEMDATKEDVDRRLAKEASRLQAEEERIMLDHQQISREEETLREEETAIEQAIASQSGDLSTQAGLLQVQVDAVTQEILELERLLRAKKADQSKLQLELEGFNRQLNDVRRKYDRQLQRIVSRKDAVIKAQRECGVEEDQHAKEASAFQEEKRTVESTREAVRLWSMNADSDVSIADLVRLSMSCGSNFDGGFDSKKYENGCGNEARDALISAEEALETAQSALKELQMNLSSLMDEAADIETKIPILETEKKSHAAAKRFKEAGSTAKDIKSLQSRREEIDGEVSSLRSQLHQAEVDVRTQMSLVELCSSRVLESKKEESMQKFNALLLRVGQLRKVKKPIARESLSRPAIAEFDSGAAFTVVSAVQHIVESELECLLLACQEIKAEFGLTDSLEEEESPREFLETVDERGNADRDEETNRSSEEVEVSGAANEAVEHVEPLSETQRAELRKEATLLRKELIALETSLEAAAEDEDYELADEINEKITQAQQHLDNILGSIGLTCEILESEGQVNDTNSSEPHGEKACSREVNSAESELSTHEEANGNAQCEELTNSQSELSALLQSLDIIDDGVSNEQTTKN